MRGTAREAEKCWGVPPLSAFGAFVTTNKTHKTQLFIGIFKNYSELVLKLQNLEIKWQISYDCIEESRATFLSGFYLLKSNTNSSCAWFWLEIVTQTYVPQILPPTWRGAGDPRAAQGDRHREKLLSSQSRVPGTQTLGDSGDSGSGAAWPRPTVYMGQIQSFPPAQEKHSPDRERDKCVWHVTRHRSDHPDCKIPKAAPAGVEDAGPLASPQAKSGPTKRTLDGMAAGRGRPAGGARTQPAHGPYSDLTRTLHGPYATLTQLPKGRGALGAGLAPSALRAPGAGD